MYNVKFARGSQLAYDGLATKDAGTLYFITDTNGNQAFYLGTLKLSSVSEVAGLITQANAADAAIAAIQSALAGINYTASENADTVLSAINNAVAGATTLIGDLDDLETTSKTDLVSAINEVRTAANNSASGNALTVTTTTNTNGQLKQYVLRQGTATQENPDSNIIATIDIPKDLVVASGRVVKATVDTNDSTKFVDEGGNEVGVTAAGTYIELTIANQDEPLYIDVAKLIDTYTAQENATQVQLNVVNNVISGTIVAGSIGATELGTDAVTTVKIADNNVTKAKLSATLQASIDAADSAVQSVATGTTNGTISVDNTDVAVYGLGGAAYADTTDFDAAGAAADVLGVNTDTDAAYTVYGAHAHANSAETAAKAYTDDALTWGSIGGNTEGGDDSSKGGDTTQGGD